ncbi:MAG: cytochrome C554 [Chlorobi bacterium]|nr:cytochrome C554 [Chlorobiota bacterium]
MKTKMLFLMALSLILFSGVNAQDYEYIGAKKCKMCHNKPDKGEQYNKWAAGPHAKAMEVLNAEEAQDAKCLKCHSTAGAADEDMLTDYITVEEGVSCESCHGPGSVYKNLKIMKSREESMANGLILPTDEVCRKCHNEESPNFKGFNFEEYVAKIAHPYPEGWDEE